MSDDGYLFSTSAVARTAKAVRKVESALLDLTDRDTPRDLVVGDDVWITIVSNAAGGGHYVIKINDRPSADISPAANAAAGDFGAPYTPPYGTIYASNAPEIDQDTHALAAGRVCKGTVIRRQTDGATWVAIEAYGFEDCVGSA